MDFSRREFIIAGTGFVGAIAATSFVSFLPGSPAVADSLGVVSPVASQPTTWGRIIQDLTIFDGIVWVGYGDWNSNTGPMRAYGWDIANQVWVDEGAIDTENNSVMRVIGDKMVVPFIDRRSTGDVAWRHRGGGWEMNYIGTNSGVGTYHCFDAASLDGTDIFLVGAALEGSDAYHNDGGVWRSPSGNGNDWEMVLRLPAQNDWGRVNSIASCFGKLFISGYGYLDTVGRSSVDGINWVKDSQYTFIKRRGIHGYNSYWTKPQVFDGKIFQGGLVMFNGQKNNEITYAPLWCVGDNALWFIDPTDKMLHKATKTTRTGVQSSATGLVLDDPFMNAVAVQDGTLWYGTSDSRLHKVVL